MLSVTPPENAAAGSPRIDTPDTGPPPHIDTFALFASGASRGATRVIDGGVRPIEELRFDPSRLRVHNARLPDRAPTLDRNGFQLARIDTGANGGMTGPELEAAFISEAQALVQSLTGGRDASLYNRMCRTGFSGLAADDPRGLKPAIGGAPTGYALRVHTDVSPLLERLPGWQDRTRGHHFALYGVWRSTDFGGPVEQMPLALCDARNVSFEDMVATISNDLLPMTYVLARNPFQYWHYFPRMTAEEAVVLRLYDTREPDPARRGVFHVAVEDPTSPPDARPRLSMETRVLVFFEKETEPEARRARFLAEMPPMPDSAGPRHTRHP